MFRDEKPLGLWRRILFDKIFYVYRFGIFRSFKSLNETNKVI